MASSLIDIILNTLILHQMQLVLFDFNDNNIIDNEGATITPNGINLFNITETNGVING